MDKEKLEEFKSYLKENLSKKRFTHSQNVAKMSKELAEIYDEDKERAYFAGLVHDIAKELPKEEQLMLAKRCELDVSQTELDSPPLLHAVAGAQVLKERFNVTDEGILLAVRYHTVGAAKMSKLSQIVYLADLTSEDRDYKDVKKMRKYVRTSLEKGMVEALKFSIADSAGKSNTIPVSTIECYNEFLLKLKSNG